MAIDIPTLIIPGGDWRHPAGLAKQLAEALPYGRLASVCMSTDLQSSDDFGRAFAPVIHTFLAAFYDIFSDIKSLNRLSPPEHSERRRGGKDGVRTCIIRSESEH